MREIMINWWRAFRFSVLSTAHWARITIAIMQFVLLGGLAVISTVISARPGGGKGNVWDAAFTVFSGFTPEASLFEIIFSFTPLLFFMLLFGNLAKEDLYLQPMYILLRIGSRRTWWWGKVASLAAAALCYYGLGMAVVIVFACRFLPLSGNWSSFMLLRTGWFQTGLISTGAFIFWALLLSAGTALGSVLAQWILSMVTGNSFYAVIITMFLLVTPTRIGVFEPGLIKWLPGTQGSLLCHTAFNPLMPGFSLTWSLIYNFLFTFICAVMGMWLLDRIDLYGNRGDETN